MFNWKELIASKKFKVAVAAVICLLVVDLANGQLSPTTIDEIVKIIMVYIGAQGIADLGKAR